MSLLIYFYSDFKIKVVTLKGTQEKAILQRAWSNSVRVCSLPVGQYHPTGSTSVKLQNGEDYKKLFSVNRQILGVADRPSVL